MDEEQLKSCIYCFIIGDSIGSGGTKWKNISNSDKYFMFIAEGGINKIDLKDYPCSINSIFMIAALQIVQNKFNNLESLCEDIREELVTVVSLLRDNEYEGGYIRTAIGRVTGKEKEILYDKQPYDNYTSNITCSMCLPIGIIFNSTCDYMKLVEYSIEVSRIVQNSVIGYLSGLISALFTSYAINKVPLELWAFKVVKILESADIQRYIKKVGRDVDEYVAGIKKYVEKWKRYVSTKFDKDGNIIKKRSSINLLWRSKYYYDLGIGSNSHIAGDNGDDCMIIVLDCLLDSNGKWETLVFYSMLHMGDTGATGGIAAFLYGLIFRMDDIPNINYKNIHSQEKLDNLIINLRKNLGK